MYYLIQGFEKAEEDDTSAALDEIKAELASIKEMLRVSSTKESQGLPLNEVTQVVQEAASRFTQITKVWLFGSYARGTAAAESDIDLRIETNESSHFNLYELAQFAKFIEQKTCKEVDVVSARKIKNESLRNAIEADGVLIYERQDKRSGSYSRNL